MKKVLINVEDRELRVAILEDDQLAELYVESLENKTILNNIYKGRVEGVIPGLKAAFVNIGLERNAFLHFDDVRPDLLLKLQAAKRGDAVTVPEAEPEAQAPVVEEYQPTQEELAVVEAMAEPAVPKPGEHVTRPEGDGHDKRRRRRGRRGGRRRHGDESQQHSQPQQPAQQPEQSGHQPAPGPRPQSHSQPQPQRQGANARDEQGGGKRNKRRRRRGRGERGDQQPGQQPSLGNWAPPPGNGLPGSRGASNPYDVFTPFSPSKASRRDRRRSRESAAFRLGPTSLPPDMHIDKESQTDFFGPVRPGGQNDEPYPEDELQPAVLLKRPPEQDLPDDVFEGPAPGNEKNQVPQKKTDPGKSRRRGGQHRTIRRKGPARYAARRKDAESEVDQKPTKAPKARATAPKAAELKTKSVATDQDAVAAKKPKSGRTSKPKAEVPVEKTKPAKAPKPGAQPKASKPKAAKAVAEEKKEEAAPAKKTTRSRRKVAETPPTDVPSAVTAATPAPVAPVEIEKPKDAGIVAAAAPPAAEPVVERPKSGRRRSSRRGRKTEAPQAAEQSSAPAAETASATVQESQAVAPGESVDTPAPAPVGPPAKGHRQSRRDRERQREVERPRRPPRPAPVSEVLKKGDEIMVQVIKEEIGLKGARISSYVSLPGRYLVLLPYPNEEGGISRKVESLEERKRLKRMIREIRQDIGEDEVGFIVRTAGVDREEKDIRNDVEFLMQEWELVREREKTARPPDMVYDDSNILYRLCRDVFDESISEILIDSHKEADKLRETLRALIPGLVDRVAVYENPENIFTHYQVERMIQKAARRKVWLKSGGYIIIDEAEALTAIDVNTGKFIGKDDQEKMILKTNLEAARTIAKELKLRDIGGLIVVDFIDMRDSRNRDQLLNEFRAHLRRDRSKTSVSSISEFGLVEMTRKRVRQSLRKTLFMDCPYCQGAGVVLNEQQIWIHIKNEIIRIAEGASPAPNLNIVVNPRIRAHLEQNYRDALTRFEDKYGIEIRVGMSDVFHVENYAIERMTRSGERISLPVGVEANGGGEH